MQFIVIIAWSIFVGYLAKKKGRNPFLYGGLCLIVSPLIMMIIVLCVSDKSQTAQSGQGWETAGGQTINLDESQYTIQDAPEGQAYTEAPSREYTEAPSREYTDTQSQTYTEPQSAGCTCPACGSPITKAGAKFCENCGYSLVEE